MERRPRPFGVTIVVVLLLASAVVVLASAVIGLFGALQAGAPIEPLPARSTLGLIGGLVATAVGGAAALAAAIGLLHLRRWAWVLVMLIVGAQMADNLWQYLVVGQRPYFEMLLNVALVFYLNQREVQRAFGQHTPHDRLEDAPITRAP